jgi:hypothetical protein
LPAQVEPVGQVHCSGGQGATIPRDQFDHRLPLTDIAADVADTVMFILAQASAGIVEDHAQHVAITGVHRADTMAHLHAMIATGAPLGPVKSSSGLLSITRNCGGKVRSP